MERDLTGLRKSSYFVTYNRVSLLQTY